MATKTIILVRHGQYHPAAEKELERLTKLGRRQAKYAGKRLKEVTIDRIIYSTMPRAIETAGIIKQELKYSGTFESCSSLCECTPVFPKHLRKKHGHTDAKKMATEKAQAERAFKKYFKSSRSDSIEVLVCHGNIIRYLVCRLLGINPLNWRAMDIKQCGISVVEIRSIGSVRNRLISHNDVGHIPHQHRTFL